MKTVNARLLHYLNISSNSAKPSVLARAIDVIEDYGAAEGYITSTDTQTLYNWADRYNISTGKWLSNIRKKYHMVAILNNLNVNEDERNQSQGTYLLEAFIENAGNAQAILLVADTSEHNEFDLVKWYKRMGFKVIKSSSGVLLCFVHFKLINSLGQVNDKRIKPNCSIPN